MQEESRWRDALAQQIASQYQVNPQVAAVLVEGSVARDCADYFSDLDLAVFWAEPPTAQERRDIIRRAARSYRPPSPSPREAAAWKTRNVRGRVAIHVRHSTVAATKGLLAAVLERADPRLPRQQRLAALRAARPAGAQPPLLSGLALAGSPDRRDAGDPSQPFPAPQTALRHRQHRSVGLGVPTA